MNAFALTQAHDLPAARAAGEERLGVVAYTNVAPLHWGLAPWDEDGHRARFVSGVPTELNAALLRGDVDLTLMSSVAFLRHRHDLAALPDFSVASLGPVHSVTLFHHRPWADLDGARIAVTTASATSVALLEVLLRASGLRATLVPHEDRDLGAMLASFDGALLIGDAALREGVARREIGGVRPHLSDLGERWYDATRLPFTFAVWAYRRDRPPSARMVAKLRAARERGLGHLADVAAAAAPQAGVTPEAMLHYLANFRYHLGPPDRDGLLAFAARAVPDLDPADLRFAEPPADPAPGAPRAGR
ncbi:MAG: menaquinone biosynthesis protein [Trueperaceae bacterium]|nr:menaquinone biosynthesis protein [Trueperaceae bacterium]